LNVEEVHITPLGRLRAEIDLACCLLYRAHEGLEHEVEEPGFGKRVLGPANRALATLHFGQIGPESAMAVAALHQGVREPLHVARSFPDFRMHQNGGVHPLDILPLVDHGTPPTIFDVPL